MKQLLSLLLTLALLAGCNTQRKTVAPPEDPLLSDIFEERNLDTLVISAPSLFDDEELPETYTLPKYNPSATRLHDLLHTRLDLRFDWEKEQVIGKATLKLKPYFYPASEVTLDAKGFTFQKVTFASKSEPLKYTYDDQQITIQLGRPYQRNEEYTLYIEYIATPGASGGSAAITSDKGLYFINPRGEDPDKPTQIWTQGETESNSKWFPTIDKPNERCTQEVYVTVEDKYTTLSNGLLVSSKKNADGTRTDYWKMDQGHAPYLFMLAIGEFAVVKDQWRDIPLEYYVEPKYKDHAKAIFAHTPEMLEFFSTKLGVKYPWSKYAQVVVRDYVSGAMENTTAVIFGEFVQKTTRELIDDGNDGIVAHEMFHHWFGDYVTCESWANLTMNEGFANYSEYLWNEHKYGADEADYNLFNEWNGYFSSARGGGVHPLIHFGYEDKEDMFDAHSYNKGGSVLHMLRNYVGDDAFFAALNKYLNDNAYQAVEAHDLRLAFEAVTGQDLNWFFNQWFFAAGHPVLNIEYEYDATANMATVTVTQTQPAEDGVPPIFQIPAAIDIYTDAGKTRHQVWMKERTQQFSFEVAQEPRLMTFDADRVLLCEKQEEKTEAAYIFQYKNGPKFLDRYEALQNLAYSESAAATEIFRSALADPSWIIRAIAINYVEDNSNAAAMNTLRQMAAADPRSQVRATALEKLTELEDAAAGDIAKKAIEQDSAYAVVAAGLQALVVLAPEEATTYAQKLEKEESSDILAAISSIYAQSSDAAYLPFFVQNINRVDGYNALGFLESYQILAAELDFDIAMDAMQHLKKVATENSSLWRRFGATRSLNQMRNYYNQIAKTEEDEATQAALQQNVLAINQMIEDIKAVETNAQLKSLYNQLTLQD